VKITLTLLVLLTTLTSISIAAPQGLPRMIMPEGVGVNIHFTGREDKQVDQIAKGGFRWIRMDFAWGGIETVKGKYDFKAYDELVTSLAQRKIRALFILDYSNPLYDDNKAPYTDEGRAAFARFAGASAAHFKGRGVLWEIWNEPNIGFWQPKPSAEDYVKLAKAVHAAVKKSDPKSTILGPALAGWDFNYIESACKLGMLEAVDAVSLHAYGALKPEDASKYFSKIHEIVQKYAIKGKKYTLVSGEWGYSTLTGGVSLDKQGEFIARCFLSNTMNGVPLSIWYDWHNDGPDPKENEHNFGTVFQDFSEKPSYKAVHTLSTELKGYGYVKRLFTESDDDYLALFKKGNDYRLVAWTTVNPHKANILTDNSRVEIVSVNGVRSVQEPKSGRVELELSGGVQYIEPSKPSKLWKAESELSTTCDLSLKNGSLQATITASSPDIATVSSPLKVEGDGLSSFKYTTRKHNGITEHVCTADYVAIGDATRKAIATVKIAGVSLPLRRMLSLDSPLVPQVIVAPPTGRELVVQVKLSNELNSDFTGTISIADPQGIQPSAPAAFKIPAGKSEGFARVTLESDAPANFSLACILKGSSGKELVRTPVQRYSVIETFSGGNPGDAVAGYVSVPDGDYKIIAKSSLTWANAPAGGPGTTCAKLDYKTEAGWRFFRVAPANPMPISGEPKSVRIWVSANTNGDQSNLRFVDSEDETFQVSYGKLESSEWRVLEARVDGKEGFSWGNKLDGILQYPTRWDTLFLADSMNRAESGSIYLGPMMLVY